MPVHRIPVNIRWTGATGSPGVNVWHGRTGTFVPADPDLAELTEILRLFYVANAFLFTSSTTIAFDGETSGVGPDAGSTSDAPAWTVQGQGGASFLPPATAAYVNWRTPTGGRSGRGRTFLGPLATPVAEGNGTPTEAQVTSMQAAADGLISAQSGIGDGALGVWSRQDGVLRDFVSANVPNKFAVLRSRRD